MIEYDNSSGLGGNVSRGVGHVSAKARSLTGSESRPLKARRVARMALSAALLSSTALIAAGAVAPARAADITWEGNVSGDWEDSDNWSGAFVVDNNVIIPGVSGLLFNPIFSGLGAGSGGQNPAVASITVQGAAGPFDGTLTIVNGTLTVAGEVKLSSSDDTSGGAGNGIIDITSAGGAAGIMGGSLNISSGANSKFVVTKGDATFSGAATVGAGALIVGVAGGDEASFTADVLEANGAEVFVSGQNTTLTITNNAVFDLASGGVTVATGHNVEEGRGFLVGGNLTLKGPTQNRIESGLLSVEGEVLVDGSLLAIGGDPAFSAEMRVAGGLQIHDSVSGDVLENGTLRVAGEFSLGNGVEQAGMRVTDGAIVAGGSLAINNNAGLLIENAGTLTVGSVGAPADLRVSPGGLIVLSAQNYTDEAVQVVGNLVIEGNPGDELDPVKGIVLQKGTVDVTGAATVTNRVVLLGTGPDSAVLSVRQADSAPGVTNGTLTIDQGSVALAGADSKLNVGDVVLANDGELLFLADADTTATAYTISGVGRVGIGAQVELGGDNTFEGDVKLGPDGLLTVNKLSSLGAEGHRKLTFADGAVTFGSKIESDAGVAFAREADGKSIIVTTNPGADKTFTISQQLTGKGDVLLGSDGINVLAGDNDFEGKVTIGAGTVQISKLANLGVAPEVEFSNDTTLAIAGNELANDTGMNLALMNGAGLSVVDKDHTFTLAQNIAADIKKRGAGTLVLTGTNTNTGLTIEAGTLAATDRSSLGDAAGVNVTLVNGFLKVGMHNGHGIVDDTGLAIALTPLASGGFDIDTDHVFAVNNGIAGAGTLVKKGAGTLMLAGSVNNVDHEQIGNMITGGTLVVSDLKHLGADNGDSKKVVTLAGGILGIDGTTLADDEDIAISLLPGGHIGFDIVDDTHTFTVTQAIQEPAQAIIPVSVLKRGAGTLVLENKDIAYSGITRIDDGVLKAALGTGQDDENVFRFKEGRYQVNGGTLELDTSAALTITALAGDGETGNEILDGDHNSYEPKRYELNAGTIQVAAGSADDIPADRRETELTLKETAGANGFWGKIVGFFTAGADPDANPEQLAGKLIVAADAGKEVVLTGNASKVGAVDVTGGTLRVNSGTLPVPLLGAPLPLPGPDMTTHAGSLTANAVAVNGTANNRAYLAGSGKIVAPAVTIGEFGSLLGNRPGTLSVEGNVTFTDGATIELGNFASHHNLVNATDIANQYFHVDGTVTGAQAGTLVNLDGDQLDPGVYRVVSSTNAIVNGSAFAMGETGDKPPGSVILGLSGEGKNLDMFSTTDRAGLRYWNGGSTWAINGTEWTDKHKGNAGRLHETVDSNVVGVFGYTDFPQGGTITVQGGQDAHQYLTQGLQFFSGYWTLEGDSMVLKGGAADTVYANRTTINTGTGAIAIANQLTGSAALRKTGVGSLTLSGNNSYEGGTIIDSGTLKVSKDSNLGAAGTSVTLNGAGATLKVTGSGLIGSYGSYSPRDIIVNLPSDTSGSVNLGSTIDMGGYPIVAGGLSGNGHLTLANGFAIFSEGSGVNFGGVLNVRSDAELQVQESGYINTANVSGGLTGYFGDTLTIDNLNLASDARVILAMLDEEVVPAFKGTNVALDGEIEYLFLPDDYAVGPNGTSLPVFDYVNRTGEIVVSDGVEAMYADSNFTFGGVVNGYLVLNAKGGPAPTPDDDRAVNVDDLATLHNWTETVFVDGKSWNNGVATFSGTGTDKPVNVEGQVRIAGLTINGQDFLFRDASVTGKPGAFLLQAASGSTTVDFVVAKDGTATISIPVAGADFAKKGEGHLVLSGNSTDFTGTGSVDEGTLHVTGNFSNGVFTVTSGVLRINGVVKQVTVGPNGTLEGMFSGDTTGRDINIGTLVVNGGTLNPGNSPGVLRVGGLTQTAGTINFEPGDGIEVLRDVGGTPNGEAIFNRAADGTQVDLRITDTRGYTYGNNYTFVTAENGVTIVDDAVKVTEVGNSRLFSSFRAEAAGNEGRFFLQRDRRFGTQAWSGNQLSVAYALESLTPADLRSSRGPIYDAIASASNDEAHLVRVAFGQLSGEIHASAKGVLIDESRHLREATSNRTRAALSGSAAPAPGQVVYAPQGSNLALWGQAYGSWGETSSSSNTAKVDRSTGGFVLGFDTGIADNWRLGIAGGYAKSDIKSRSNLSKADVDNYNLAIYGGSQYGDLGLRFGMGHTWHRLDTERQLNVLGLRDSNHAKYDARTLQLYAEAGYEVRFEAATVEPFLNLAYVHHHSDSFLERGLGLGSALASRDQDESTGFSTLGMRVSKNFDLSGAKGKATGTLGWRRAFGDVNPTSVFSANGTSLFAITGAPIAKNALVLGVGLDVEIAQGATLGVSYNGQVGDHTSDHGVRGNFSVKF